MTLFNLPPYLDWPAQFCLFLTGATWVASLVTKNVSQVDRLWTFLPTIYTAYYAFLPALPPTQTVWLMPYAPKALGWHVLKDYSPRAVLMFGLIFIWMCRLSYNTYRRGLFNLHDEDYRWAVLRQRIPAWLFQVTNLTFISATQNVLLLLLGLPTYIASVIQPHTPLAASDYALAVTALTLLLIEFTADNQQFAFQTYKHAFLAKEKGDASVKAYNEREQWPGARLEWTPDDARRGFVTRGLWRYSRHPNFVCEQSFWWLINLMPLLSSDAPNPLQLREIPPLRAIIVSLFTPSLWQPLYASLRTSLWPSIEPILPAMGLSLLGYSSIVFTESISLSKYPSAYKAYQTRVGMYSVGHTVLKGLWVKYVHGDLAKERVERLVWGDSVAKEKTK